MRVRVEPTSCADAVRYAVTLSRREMGVAAVYADERGAHYVSRGEPVPGAERVCLARYREGGAVQVYFSDGQVEVVEP